MHGTAIQNAASTVVSRLSYPGYEAVLHNFTTSFLQLEFKSFFLSFPRSMVFSPLHGKHFPCHLLLWVFIRTLHTERYYSCSALVLQEPDCKHVCVSVLVCIANSRHFYTKLVLLFPTAFCRKHKDMHRWLRSPRVFARCSLLCFVPIRRKGKKPVLCPDYSKHFYASRIWFGVHK